MKSCSVLLAVWTVAAAALVSTQGLAATALKDPFAGNWKILATSDTTGKTFNDTLSFKGGDFTPAELVKKGWVPAAYEDDVRQGGVAQFKVTIKHPSQGEMKWTGSITASEIRGNLVWTKPDGEEERYTYNGTKL